MHHPRHQSEFLISNKLGSDYMCLKFFILRGVRTVPLQMRSLLSLVFKGLASLTTLSCPLPSKQDRAKLSLKAFFLLGQSNFIHSVLFCLRTRKFCQMTSFLVFGRAGVVFRNVCSNHFVFACGISKKLSTLLVFPFFMDSFCSHQSFS